MNYKNNFLLRYLTFITFLLSSGCATLEGPPNPDDPFESFNRSMFEFNEGFDKYAFKPVAKGYEFIMPSFASKGVSNFFSNIDDIVVFFNQLLQFKFASAAMTSARFVFNTTFGLLGLFDVATHMDLPKQHEDFGQTLAVWGVPQGPYMVLPIIGPITARDTAGLAVDWTYFDPIFKRQTLKASLATLAVKYIDIRASLLKASNIIDETVPDKYSFIRDAWLLRREFLIYDGHPPGELTEEELFEDDDLFNDDKLFEEGDTDADTSMQGSTLENANPNNSTPDNTNLIHQQSTTAPTNTEPDPADSLESESIE